jgi:antitoxin (DNA-binding transcriptional repressor) of toxin-antitoxin stability system
MPPVHITEAELARDVQAVLEKVRQGAEVIVERNHSPVAVIHPPPAGRKLSECIALAEAHGSSVTLDEEFGKDLEDIIESHREPLDASRWD